MGNFCTSCCAKDNKKPVVHQEVLRPIEPIVCEERVEEKQLQTVPHPVEEHQGESEADRRKLIERCLKYIDEVPREGSVQNIQQDV